MKINISSKGVAESKDSKRIYLNIRVQKAMGYWHPNYNPKLKKNKYLYGSIMIVCGYC